jgi:hypothetical protein
MGSLLEEPRMLKRPIVAISGALCLGGCDPQAASNEDSGLAPNVSYARLDPGSNAKPSNKYSRQLFEMDDQVRLATFRNFMSQSDEQCALVTGAVLRGGSHRTDMWRVSCSDSGEWMVSIDPDSSTKILSCETMKRLGDNCHAAWKR